MKEELLIWFEQTKKRAKLDLFKMWKDPAFKVILIGTAGFAIGAQLALSQNKHDIVQATKPKTEHALKDNETGNVLFDGAVKEIDSLSREAKHMLIKTSFIDSPVEMNNRFEPAKLETNRL